MYISLFSGIGGRVVRPSILAIGCVIKIWRFIALTNDIKNGRTILYPLTRLQDALKLLKYGSITKRDSTHGEISNFIKHLHLKPTAYIPFNMLFS